MLRQDQQRFHRRLAVQCSCPPSVVNTTPPRPRPLGRFSTRDGRIMGDGRVPTSKRYSQSGDARNCGRAVEIPMNQSAGLDLLECALAFLPMNLLSPSLSSAPSGGEGVRRTGEEAARFMGARRENNSGKSLSEASSEALSKRASTSWPF